MRVLRGEDGDTGVVDNLGDHVGADEGTLQETAIPGEKNSLEDLVRVLEGEDDEEEKDDSEIRDDSGDHFGSDEADTLQDDVSAANGDAEKSSLENLVRALGGEEEDTEVSVDTEMDDNSERDQLRAGDSTPHDPTTPDSDIL